MDKPPPPDPNCRIADVLDVFKGRWKGEIIALLREETLRFSSLRKRMPSASARSLTESLRGLERDGVIKRQQFDAVPLHVEYSLTGYGEELLPLLDRIQAWGNKHMSCVRACREQFDRRG
ncbi:MAG: helix-turn-helix domain-containing protein [Planctomycetota bacterium]